MEHEWHRTYSDSNGRTDWECASKGGCLTTATDRGSGKRFAIVGRRRLPIPGPAVPDSCEEALNALAVWDVLES